MPKTKIQTVLDNLARRNEPQLRVALKKWMNDTQKQIKADLTSKYQKSAASVTSTLTDWELIQENGISTVKPAAMEIFKSGGNAAYKHLAILGSFDVLNVQAVKAVNKFCSKLVVDVTRNTKKGINTFVKHGIREGWSMPKVARELRPLVGLTGKQTQSVINYRNQLATKRPDLTVAQLDKAVMRKTNKTHRMRMENIARTETANAQNIGYCQGLEDVGVEEAELRNGSNPCDECIALDKTRYPIAEAGGVITVHPRCTCVMLPVVDEKVISHPLRAPPAGLPKVKPVVKPPKPIVSPKPAEKLFQAENTGKAEANAHRILGINRFDPKQRARISYAGIDVKVANQVNKAVYTFKQKFPEMKLAEIKSVKMSTDTFFEIFAGGKEGARLVINRNLLSSTKIKKFEKDLARYYKTNYLVASDIEGLVYHELGHGLCYSHIFNKYGGEKVSLMLSQLSEVAFRAKGLSKYGAKDGVEGVAEVFSKYMQKGSIRGIQLESGNGTRVARVIKSYTGLEL